VSFAWLVDGRSIVFLDVVVVLWFGKGRSVLIMVEGMLEEGNWRRSVQARGPGSRLVLLILEGSDGNKAEMKDS